MRKRLECQRRPCGYQGGAGQYRNYSYPWLQNAGQRMWIPGSEEDREEKQDLEYWKQLYPAETRRIQNEVEHQCDLLEYDGSVMYDEYPDRIALSRICEAVYQALMQESAGNAMGEYPMGMPGMMPGQMSGGMSGMIPGQMSGDVSGRMNMERASADESRSSDGEIVPEEESDEAYDFRSDSGLEMMQAGRGGRDRSLQDLIEVLLFHEIHQRRRRRRRNRSWYFG